MTIKWNNIVALILFLIALVIAAHSVRTIVIALRSIGDIGPGHTPQEQTMGLFAFSICGLLILGAVKILTAHSGK